MTSKFTPGNSTNNYGNIKLSVDGCYLHLVPTNLKPAAPAQTELQFNPSPVKIPLESLMDELHHNCIQKYLKNKSISVDEILRTAIECASVVSYARGIIVERSYKE